MDRHAQRTKKRYPSSEADRSQNRFPACSPTILRFFSVLLSSYWETLEYVIPGIIPTPFASSVIIYSKQTYFLLKL